MRHASTWAGLGEETAAADPAPPRSRPLTLTSNMRQWLIDCRHVELGTAGDVYPSDRVFGRSQSGGFAHVVGGLQRRGLIDRGQTLTPDGRAAADRLITAGLDASDRRRPKPEAAPASAVEGEAGKAGAVLVYRIRRESDGMYVGARKWGQTHSRTGKVYATKGHARSAFKGVEGLAAWDHRIVGYELRQVSVEGVE